MYKDFARIIAIAPQQLAFVTLSISFLTLPATLNDQPCGQPHPCTASALCCWSKLWTENPYLQHHS